MMANVLPCWTLGTSSCTPAGQGSGRSSPQDQGRPLGQASSTPKLQDYLSGVGCGARLRSTCWACSARDPNSSACPRLNPPEVPQLQNQRTVLSSMDLSSDSPHCPPKLPAAGPVVPRTRPRLLGLRSITVLLTA